MDSVKDLLGTADVTFGNLEGTFLNSGPKPNAAILPITVFASECLNTMLNI
ncbi:MAG: hypothetical protein IPI04_19450 [Ignavibacteria bacterium]|nr:hypothetical protein [Ignavibacteria bacterium]